MESVKKKVHQYIFYFLQMQRDDEGEMTLQFMKVKHVVEMLHRSHSQLITLCDVQIIKSDFLVLF